MNAETKKPWNLEKRQQWFKAQTIKRLYQNDVLVRVAALGKQSGPELQVDSYGALSVNPEKYPLYAFRVGNQSGLPTVLITGGVHGYETSGVKGALLFLEQHASRYTRHFNFVVAPCISPWSYETINRLNPEMENPNRNFKTASQSEEAKLLMDYLARLKVSFSAHIDLHETTDSDKVFIPEEYDKNGLSITPDEVDIPDGFYLIGVKGIHRPELEAAMIESVRKVTHIAKANAEGMISDRPSSHEGMIHSDIPGLCAQYTEAKTKLGAFTTEVYPDGPKFKSLSVEKVEAICSEAQVACIRGALDFWIKAAGK